MSSLPVIANTSYIKVWDWLRIIKLPSITIETPCMHCIRQFQCKGWLFLHLPICCFSILTNPTFFNFLTMILLMFYIWKTLDHILSDYFVCCWHYWLMDTSSLCLCLLEPYPLCAQPETAFSLFIRWLICVCGVGLIQWHWYWWIVVITFIIINNK